MQLQPYVYFEHVLVINLALNSLILWTTGKFAGIKIQLFRLLLGALVGALFSFALLFPQMNWVTGFSIKLGLSLIMLSVVFAPVPWRRFLSCMAYFYLVSFTLGGAVIAMAFNAQGLFDSFNLAALLPRLSTLLVIVLLGGAVVSQWGHRIYKSRAVQRWFKVKTIIEVGDHRVELSGLIDTGNQLRDPVTGWPVVVVEEKSLGSFLPFNADMLNTGSYDTLLALQEQEDWACRVRLIPFRSLGANNGVLVGFRPDRVVVQNGNALQEINEVIIGVSRDRLSPQGHYQALLHPDLLGNGMMM